MEEAQWERPRITTATPEFQPSLDLTVEKLLWQAKRREVVCIRTACGARAAVKRYNLKDSSTVAQHTIVNEMRVHHSLHQIKTVVEMLGAFQVDDSAFIVTAYHPRGNLLRFMKKLGRPLTDGEAVNAVVLPLLYTIMRIHSKGIVHGDIKMENVLVNKNSVVMLADFGMATINDHACRDRHYMGTVAYSAPEMFWRPEMSHENIDLSQHYQKRDIFALGVLICEVLQGRQPFGRDRRDKVSLKHSIIHDEPALASTLSPRCVDFIKLCLHKNPFRRPDCWQLLFHPWVRDHALDKEQYRIIRSRASSTEGLPRSVTPRPHDPPPDMSVPNFLTPHALEVFAPERIDDADEAVLRSIAQSIAHCVASYMAGRGEAGCDNRENHSPDAPDPCDWVPRPLGPCADAAAGCAADGALEPCSCAEAEAVEEACACRASPAASTSGADEQLITASRQRPKAHANELDKMSMLCMQSLESRSLTECSQSQYGAGGHRSCYRAMSQAVGTPKPPFAANQCVPVNNR